MYVIKSRWDFLKILEQNFGDPQKIYNKISEIHI